jgi:L-arabinokinase
MLSDDIRITVKSDVPARFFEEELTVPHSVIEGSFDVGCLQRDGITVLIEETLKTYSGISANNALLLDDEARWCADNKVGCIVSDITSFAFDVADKANVPSIAISNFTWYDIYLPYIDRFPQYAPVLPAMADQYGKATLALALYPSSPMLAFKNKMQIPIVGKKGQNRRAEIFDRFGINHGKRLGLIYTGNFGLDSVNWRRLENFRGWEFVGVYPLPGDPKNFHTVTKDQFRYGELSASADAIIGKMGYGVFSESLLNGVPLIYLPREDFSEFPILDAEAKRLGSGVCIDAKKFAALEWLDILEDAVAMNGIKPADGGGAAICASEIIKLFNCGR